jgi:hypothetical protein
MHTNFWLESLKGRDNTEYHADDGKNHIRIYLTEAAFEFG